MSVCVGGGVGMDVGVTRRMVREDDSTVSSVRKQNTLTNLTSGVPF